MSFPVMSSASRVNGVLFILLLAAMLLYSTPRVVAFARTQEPSTAATQFMSGELLRQFEDYYDKGLFLRQPSVEAWASLQYLLFREGSSGVVLGKDGWLFSNEEYRVPGAYQQALEEHLSRIAEVEKTLKAHNKRLILLPLPLKLDVYEEYASRAPDARAKALYDDFLSGLRAQRKPRARRSGQYSI